MCLVLRRRREWGTGIHGGCRGEHREPERRIVGPAQMFNCRERLAERVRQMRFVE